MNRHAGSSARKKKRGLALTKQGLGLLQLQYIIEHSGAAIAVLDREMRYLLVSERWCSDYQIGLSKEEILGKNHYDVFPDIPEKWKIANRKGLNGEILKNEADLWCREGGERVWVHWEIHPWLTDSHKIGGIFIFSENISRRKEAEISLWEARESLAISNASLEWFAEMASHDLQEPLRMVVTYLSLLEKRCQSSLDSKSLEFLEFAKDGALKMKLLVKEVLSYSRLFTGSLHLEMFNTEDALKTVLKRLYPLISNCDAVFTISSLPFVRTNRVVFEQVLQNLISNALKFRSEQSPKIEVAAQRGKSNWIFSITDNGEGIPEEYRGKVFQPFQRFHNGNVPGTGLGLMMTRRMVQWLGGGFWFESTPMEGTTFYFEIVDNPSRTN